MKKKLQIGLIGLAILAGSIAPAKADDCEQIYWQLDSCYQIAGGYWPCADLALMFWAYCNY